VFVSVCLCDEVVVRTGRSGTMNSRSAGLGKKAPTRKRLLAPNRSPSRSAGLLSMDKEASHTCDEQ
jgi:hypothetical protein